MDFSVVGSSLRIDLDTTKPLKAGTLAISKLGGPVVRSLATPVSTDGSLRLTWDGLDDSGKGVPAGAYSYRLVADAADGSGTVAAIDGTAVTSGTVTVQMGTLVGWSPGAYLAMTPTRLMDTRTGRYPMGQEFRALQILGRNGIPATNVSAVTLNVTVTETTTSGFLTLYPDGANRPNASNLNWTPGTTIANAVTVKVGSNGMVDIFQSGPGTAQVVVDIAGYYVGGTLADAGGFSAVTPARILDTRSGSGKLVANEARDLQITGAGGVPASNVSAVVLNVTVTETTSTGYLTVYPSGTARPTASNLNWVPGATIPNLVTVKVGGNGKVSMYQSGPGTAQVIVDVAGYYLGGTPAKPGMFVALAPLRVLDTRPTPLASGKDYTLPLLGKSGIPATGVSAVVVNTTVTDTTAPGYLTVYPGAMSMPLASNINWTAAGTTIPNLVTVPIGYDGSITFHNGSGGTTDVVADTAGYYRS
jgi:hypothetical protein